MKSRPAKTLPAQNPLMLKEGAWDLKTSLLEAGQNSDGALYRRRTTGANGKAAAAAFFCAISQMTAGISFRSPGRWVPMFVVGGELRVAKVRYSSWKVLIIRVGLVQGELVSGRFFFGIRIQSSHARWSVSYLEVVRAGRRNVAGSRGPPGRKSCLQPRRYRAMLRNAGRWRPVRHSDSG